MNDKQKILIESGIMFPDGQINKNKINIVSGTITKPFVEMVWGTTGGDMETINRITDILVTMNTDSDRENLFKIIQMLFGVVGVIFPEEATYMSYDGTALEYFIFSVTADFGEIVQEYKIE